MTAIPDLKIQALNDAESSENRIHSDDVASSYGFSGALVSGANLFGYLTQALVDTLGMRVLENSEFVVNFRKPAYHNDPLLIQSEVLDEFSEIGRFRSCAYNRNDELLAELETCILQKAPFANEVYCPSSASAMPLRQEIHWDNIDLTAAALELHWNPSEDDNHLRVQNQRDNSPIYRGADGLIHPYYLMETCNEALKQMFILPAWIHVSSRVRIRRALRTGQRIVVQSIPTDKWKRRGHQFIRLSISMFVENELALKAEHTAIFRIAQ